MTITSNIKSNLVEIKRALSILFQPGDVVELRALDVQGRQIHAGYFNDFEKLAKEAIRLSGRAGGVYVVLNRINPELLNRSVNRITPNPKYLTQDADITRRCWLLVDVDAKRVKGISSTDAEHEAAITTAKNIKLFLIDLGFPANSIIVVDSGNGAHLLIKIDLPNDKESTEIIKSSLKAIELKFNSDSVEIDQSVFNASRICKLPGTMACKGDSSTDRPHRIAHTVDGDENIETAPAEAVRNLAILAPQAEARKQTNNNYHGSGQQFDLESWLSKYGIEVQRKEPYEGGYRYIFRNCVFNPAHNGTSAAAFQKADGTLGYKCQHNECMNKHWVDVRELFEPGYREPNNGHRNHSSHYEISNSFNLTDIGNAERLVAKFGGKIRYSFERKSWLIWTGKVWQWDAGNLIVKLAIETVRGIYNEATNTPDKEKREAIASHGMKSENSSRIDAMIDKARSLVSIKINQLDANPWLFNVNNGTINLRTGQLQPHDSNDFNTVLVPINYKPSAGCPQWNQFLNRVTDNSETLRQYLQRAVGYSLTEDIKLQVFFFLYGTGNNGKSTFIMTIRRILGAYGTKLAIEDLMTQEKKNGNAPNEEIADLRNKRFVFASEIEQGRRLAVGLIKDMTGGETVKVRHLYGSPFEFSPTFKLWISGNHKPTITDTTLSIWRRLKMIPFTVTIPFQEVDENLPSKLEAELEGILAWAVQGCLNYQTQGLGEPNEVKIATSSYRRDEDILADFIEDACILKPEDNDFVITKADMKVLYIQWCETNGVVTLGQKNFKTRLIEKGVRDGHTTDKKQRAWLGIREKVDYGQNDGPSGQNESNFERDGQNRQDLPINHSMEETQETFMESDDILSRRGYDSVQDRKNHQNPDKMTEPIFTSNELLIKPCPSCGATNPVAYDDSFACGNCHPGLMNELLNEPTPGE